MDGLDTVQHKNLKTIRSHGRYFTVNTKLTHSNRSKRNSAYRGEKKKKKKFKKIVLNIWENLRHEPSDLSSIEQIMVFICHRINRAV